MNTAIRLAYCGLVLLVACVGRSAPSVPAPATASISGARIVSPGDGTDVSVADMLGRLMRADVVVFGEQHDDPETHRVEAELLKALTGTRRPVVLSLEMFERDVQPVLDGYLAGRTAESEFLARSRPWDRYTTDYRMLIENAKRGHSSVVAANIPRPLASAIGRLGLAVLDTLPAAVRAHVARELQCPRDDYRARFMESMRSHGGAGPEAGSDSLPTAVAERFYLAQCAKDETMAESIVSARLSGPRDALVVHYDGAFHSDYAQGTVARIKRRQPTWDIVVITALPVADPAVAPIAPQRGKADFVVFTRRAGTR